jgi:hypothetical protein
VVAIGVAVLALVLLRHVRPGGEAASEPEPRSAKEVEAEAAA